jgi:hypothetical protein
MEELHTRLWMLTVEYHIKDNLLKGKMARVVIIWFGIRFWIHMILGLPDPLPDPLVTSTDVAPDPAPDPSIIKQK